MLYCLRNARYAWPDTTSHIARWQCARNILNCAEAIVVFFTTGNVNGETEDGWPTLPKIFAYIISAQWLRSTVWNIASFNWRKPKIIVHRGHGSCCCCCCVFCDVKAFARAMHIYIWTQSLICYQMAQCCFAIRFVMLHITSTAMVTSSSPAASIRTVAAKFWPKHFCMIHAPINSLGCILKYNVWCARFRQSVLHEHELDLAMMRVGHGHRRGRGETTGCVCMCVCALCCQWFAYKLIVEFSDGRHFLCVVASRPNISVRKYATYCIIVVHRGQRALYSPWDCAIVRP